MAIPKIQAGNDINADTFLKTPNGQEDYGIKTNNEGKIDKGFLPKKILEIVSAENISLGYPVIVDDTGQARTLIKTPANPNWTHSSVHNNKPIIGFTQQDVVAGSLCKVIIQGEVDVVPQCVQPTSSSGPALDVEVGVSYVVQVGNWYGYTAGLDWFLVKAGDYQKNMMYKKALGIGENKILILN